MGYTTDFEGEFPFDKPLSPEHTAYLRALRYTRRMKRDPSKLARVPDPVREAVGLPLGPEGDYFVAGAGLRGQDKDASIVDFSNEPGLQPGLWCQWEPNESGTALRWDEGEKFYNYVEWLEYLIEHLIRPWGYTLNGRVKWTGEDTEDAGTIVVKDNDVTTV